MREERNQDDSVLEEKIDAVNKEVSTLGFFIRMISGLLTDE